MSASNDANVLDKLLSLINPETAQGLRNLTAAFMVALALIFYYVFIGPVDVIERMGGWGILILVIGAATLVVLLFSQDRLYYGDPRKSKYVRAFQARFPSAYLADRLSIDVETAKSVWLQKFNEWGSKRHPMHSQRLRTLQRGYACRFVYLILKSLAIVFGLSAVILAAEGVCRWWLACHLLPEGSLLERALVLCALGAIWVYIRSTNRIREGSLTGVWQRYAEINDLNCHWIDENLASLRRKLEKLRRGEAQQQGGTDAAAKVRKEEP